MTAASIKGLLDETREEVGRADSKASILLAGLAAGLAVLGSATLSGDVSLAGAPGVVQALSLAASGLLLGGLVFLAAAIFPRVGRGSADSDGYFSDFAEYEDLSVLRSVLERQAADESDRHLAQLRSLSRIARVKFRLTQCAFVSTGLGVAAVLLAATLNHVL